MSTKKGRIYDKGAPQALGGELSHTPPPLDSPLWLSVHP